MSFTVQVDKEKRIEKLTPLEKKVTQKEGTERAFSSDMHANKAQGIYVDKVTGRPLFASVHKYDSGTGWPSFYDVIDQKFVDTKEDKKLFFSPRTEIHSVDGTHLGHVFKDGPKDTTGLRYCINAAALDFIPLKEMAKVHPVYKVSYEKYISAYFADHTPKESSKESATTDAK